MKKGLILLADGFEETEAISSFDILRRSHAIVPTFASIMEGLEVTSSGGIPVKASVLLKDVSLADYDFLILPGGKKGVENLKASPLAMEAVDHFAALSHIYAICAAPSILGERGYLDGRKYTCFPGFQCGKGTWLDEGFVVDGNLVTGHSMAYTIPFAEAIVKLEAGEEAYERILPGAYGK